MEHEMFILKCEQCKGIVRITVLNDTDKGTEPKIEFCPFCGMSIIHEDK